MGLRIIAKFLLKQVLHSLNRQIQEIEWILSDLRDGPGLGDLDKGEYMGIIGGIRKYL